MTLPRSFADVLIWSWKYEVSATSASVSSFEFSNLTNLCSFKIGIHTYSRGMPNPPQRRTFHLVSEGQLRIFQ